MQYLESIDIKLSVEEGERKQILRILCFPQPRLSSQLRTVVFSNFQLRTKAALGYQVRVSWLILPNKVYFHRFKFSVENCDSIPHSKKTKLLWGSHWNLLMEKRSKLLPRVLRYFLFCNSSSQEVFFNHQWIDDNISDYFQEQSSCVTIFSLVTSR